MRSVPFSVICDGHRYRVFIDHLGTIKTPDGYHLGRHQIATRRIDNEHVTFERWDMSDGEGFGPWAPAPRFKTRPARARRRVLPEISDAVRDAWAGEALRQLHRIQSTPTTTARVAELLPGWDDVETFDAREVPGDCHSPLLWSWDEWVEMGAPSARKRAVALAGMALRRLAAQGRAEHWGGTRWSATGPADDLRRY
jgi:hypothetical protein